MSEFLAEARILVRPDTTRFRAELQEQVRRAVSQAQIPAVQVPVVLGVAGAGLTAVTAATAGLAAAQQTTTSSTLGLASAAQVENTAFGRQAVILNAATAATLQKAGADTTAARAATVHARRVNAVETAAIASTAGMLGLRGAVLTASSAFIGATVAFQALGKSIGLAAELERELNVFAATSGATADQMRRVSEASRELGRDITLPGVAAQDAASTMSVLARAGLDVEQAMAAARGTLQLATAAQISNAEAGELVANALNAFQLSGIEATRVADLLAGASNEAQGSITDMGIALRQAAAVANIVGLSIEDTVVLLTELARAGLASSDAGTSLRTTLLRLTGDFPKVAAEVERLNLTLRDVNGNVRPEFFAELGERMRKMTPAARQATAALLGGADAVRAISILSRRTTEDLAATERAITQSGIASDLAGAQTEGLGGDVEAAKNEFADLGTTVGQLASGPLSLFIRTASAAAGSANDLASAAREADQGFGETFGNFINRFSESFARLNLNFQTGVRRALDASDSFNILERATDAVTESTNALADALERTANATVSSQSQPKDEGLGVQQILNRVEGLDAAEVRARISGDTNALIRVLQEQQAFLIAQLDRQFVKNRPALRRALENALLGTTNDLRAISQQTATEKNRAAGEIASAQRAADQNLLSALSDRREDANRRASAAGDTAGLADDIRAQDRIQALIKQQIAKVRERVKDEQLRREAIRELRIALIASRGEEEKLRAAQKANQQERAQQLLDIKIQIAQERGNEALEDQLLRLKIKRLKKQIKDAKGQQLLVAQLTLELAQTQNALKDLDEQERDTAGDGNRAAEFFFEQLQAQQGFAANLLGNLIPRDQTAGLVGTPSPDIGARIGATASVAQGRALTAPTSGQVSTTNDILLRILAQLKGLNQSASAPEAVYQKRMGAAAMTGGGGNVEVM